MENASRSSTPSSVVIASFQAVCDGNEDAARCLISENQAAISAATPEGATLLHLAVQHGHASVARLLLEAGSDVEAMTVDGNSPLHIAAALGRSDIIELLLDFGAECDSINPDTEITALHRAVDNGHFSAAEILLGNGATVDHRDGLYRTPLFSAVSRRDHAMTEMLLQYGARRYKRDRLGTSPMDLAHGLDDILSVLKSHRIIRGPTIRPRRQRSEHAVPRFFAPRLARRAFFRGSDAVLDHQMIACHNFQATIIDFYVNHVEDAVEGRLEVFPSVYQLLYGRGPNAIMTGAQRPDESGKRTERDFRWYHLPANNIDWVEALIERHLYESDPDGPPMSKEFKSRLGLSRTEGHHSLAALDGLSFMKPMCQSVEQDDVQNSSEGLKEHVFAFMPYLHAENENGYDSMMNAMQTRRDSEAQMYPDSVTAANVASSLLVSTGVTPASQPERSTRSNDWSQLSWNSTRSSLSGGRYQTAPELCFTVPSSVKETNGITGLQYPGARENKWKARIDSLEALHTHLVKGYLHSRSKVSDPALQPRRTLDQYFYSHIDTSQGRDKDQVVFKYTKQQRSLEPQLFMVDQLWLWVINGDTVVSCFPGRWRPLQETNATANVQAKNPPKSTRTPATMMGITLKEIGGLMFRRQRPPGVRVNRRTQRWAQRQATGVQRHSGVPGDRSSNESFQGESEVRLSDQDPLNVLQSVLEHLSVSTRKPLKSSYDLASLITNFCASVFDHYKVSEDFQLFHLFEKYLEFVSERTTWLLTEFRNVLNDDSLEEVANVVREIELLVEAQDVCDELNIIRLLLKEQQRVMLDMVNAIRRVAPVSDGSLTEHMSYLKNNRVQARNMEKVESMEERARQATENLTKLIDLKQKQASMEHARQAAEQARQAKIQADETARQGRSVMLFTVVTILFVRPLSTLSIALGIFNVTELPLSFMAAFFTIEIDVFPRDENGQLGLDYVLKFILSISAGLSIPFILITFNMEKVVSLIKVFGLNNTLPILGGLVLVVVIVITVWTSSLNQTAKTAVTVALAVAGLLGVCAMGIKRLLEVTKSTLRGASRGTTQSWNDEE